MMDRTVDDLEGVFAYMNDSRVGFPVRQTHLLNLEAFFNALAANGLTINLKKCIFAVPTLEILGHMISATGSAPTAGHATAIESCPPPPQDIKQLQRFLGMVNFYNHFLPNCAQVSCPLTDLLKRGGGKALGVDRCGTGGFPKCKMPPSHGSAPSAKNRGVETHWCIHHWGVFLNIGESFCRF